MNSTGAAPGATSRTIFRYLHIISHYMVRSYCTGIPGYITTYYKDNNDGYLLQIHRYVSLMVVTNCTYVKFVHMTKIHGAYDIKHVDLSMFHGAWQRSTCTKQLASWHVLSRSKNTRRLLCACWQRQF